MQGANLDTGLARRVVFEDGTAGGNRMDMGNALGNCAGRGLNGKAVQGISSLGSEVTYGRSGRENRHSRRVGQTGDIARGTRGVNIEKTRPAGQEHEVCCPGGCECRGFGMRSGVDEDNSNSGFTNGSEGAPKLWCVGRGNRGPFGIAELRPGAGAGLRIQVDNGGAVAGFCGSAGKVQGKCGLTGTALLGNESNDVHG